MSITLNFRNVGDVKVVDINGNITLGEGASTFCKTIKELSANENRKLLVNLGDVTIIDNSGISELLFGFTTVTNHGGKLKLVNPTKRVNDFLQITKLDTIFEIFYDEGQAVKSFS